MQVDLSTVVIPLITTMNIPNGFPEKTENWNKPHENSAERRNLGCAKIKTPRLPEGQRLHVRE